jgi:hypothetical protein
MNRLRQAAAIMLLCTLGFAVGCGPAQHEADVEAAQWVADVRSAHAAADGALRAGQAQAALARLDAALAAEVPVEVQPEHRRAVHQDLLFRAAQVHLQAGRSGDARAAAERGLGLGRAVDLFTANLLIARGQALEADGRDTEAAASYYEALEINRVLLGKALGQPDAGVP